MTQSITEKVLPIDFLNEFRKSVYMNPGKSALEMDGLKISYAELDTKSEELAIALKENGVVEGSVVALLLDKGQNLFTLLLALLKLKACFVTLDPSYPKNRLNHMIEDSCASFLIMDSDGTLLEKSQGLTQLKILQNGKLSCRNKGSRLGEKLDGVSYIMYTSGSTGNPKGVKITREALSFYAGEIAAAYKLDRPTSILSFSNISFDIFIEEMISWLISGSTMIILPEHLKSEPELVVNFLNKQKVSFVTLPTTYW
ncbi:AMP-binding protein, partial [Bacillus cereus]|uniref:AMP-binding protein n=1 Tax=Bacillus cereus TaxID=1396 RepID=UPI002B24B12D